MEDSSCPLTAYRAEPIPGPSRWLRGRRGQTLPRLPLPCVVFPSAFDYAASGPARWLPWSTLNLPHEYEVLND